MNILIVDDDKLQRDLLSGFLSKQGFVVDSAGNGTDALAHFAEKPYHLVILDHRMPDINGDEVLARMKELNPLVRAIMITAYGAIKTAVKVMQLGAEDFLEKPVDLTDLLVKIRKVEQHLQVEEDNASMVDELNHRETPLHIIGDSRPMQELLAMLRRFAPTPWTVLIRGETGTGKELVARLIHQLSPRYQHPFIEINCAAVPENLFESELFGHEKGAFTGASAKRIGRFELADRGTIFLDEIGELPLALQAKLLRVLQEKKISRVGSSQEREREIDVRVLVATNCNLKEMVKAGEFRQDLYFRLNVLELEVPPLRKRKEDIPLLVDFFLNKSGLEDKKFSPAALAVLARYSFPGNVRELEHLIQRVYVLCRGKVVTDHDLPREILDNDSPGNIGLMERLAQVEHEMLLAALEENNWVQTRAADSLGISERVLRYRMEKSGVKKRKQVFTTPA